MRSFGWGTSSSVSVVKSIGLVAAFCGTRRLASNIRRRCANPVGDKWESDPSPKRLARHYSPGRHGFLAQMVLYGGSDNRFPYARKFWESVDHLTEFLQKAPDARLLDALSEAGRERHNIALELNTPRANDFGEERDDGFWRTPINVFYKTTVTRTFLRNLQRQPSIYGASIRRLASGWAIVGRLPNSRETGLTRVTPDPGQTCFIGTGWRWEHPPGNKEVMSHLQCLFEALRAPLPVGDTRRRELYRRTAHLHWWLAHRCYFFRGSAAIAEMLMAALFRTHGYQHPGYREMPDVVALSTPDETQYVRAYQHLLRSTPKRLREANSAADLSGSWSPGQGLAQNA